MKKIFTFLFVLLAFTQITNAQYFNYTAANASINATTGVYTDLGSTGTKITTNFKGQPMKNIDDNSSAQNIGFTFNFAGVNYTQFTLNTNGFIKLGNDTTAISESHDVLFSTDASAANVIYPYNINLQPTVNSEFRVFTTGTVGSQTCTIQFKAVKDSGCPNCSPVTDFQYDGIEFQIILYEGSNNIDFVYGNFTANSNAAGYIPSSCGLKASDPDHSVNASKSSQTAFSGTQFVDGAYTGNRFNNRNAILPPNGFTIQFVPIAVLANNVKIATVYSNGKIPRNLSNNIAAYVQNISTTDLTNFPVSLVVTGANPFTENKTIDTLKSGQKKLVNFATKAYKNIGINTAIISIPNDDDNSNNIDTVYQLVTAKTTGTCYDTIIKSSVGSNTTSLDIAIRITNPTANKVVSVTSYISAAGKLFRMYLYGVSADTPKTKLYSGTNITSVAGKNVLTFATPVAVTGDFFVVITQLSTTTNLGCGYQSEDPLKLKTYYFRSPQGSSVAPSAGWGDAAPGSAFKIMVDATMLDTFVNLLPVKLVYFKGNKEGNSNILNWQTASEINSLGFEIQRSIDGKEFNKIGFENARGNGTTIANYSYVDNAPNVGANYYRLRQIDKDGKATFSEIIVIKNGNVKQFELVNTFPNPTKENVNITFNSLTENKVNIIVTNLLGKVVLTQSLVTQKGMNKVVVNTTTLPAGNYLAIISDPQSEDFISTKFTKQ